MSPVNQPERITQTCVIALFRDELGYRTLGDWTERENNSNIEEDLLKAHLSKNGYTPAQVSRALHVLHSEADNRSRGLYDNNKAVYSLLRYGVPVKTEAQRTGRNQGQKAQNVARLAWEERPRSGRLPQLPSRTATGPRTVTIRGRPSVAIASNGL